MLELQAGPEGTAKQFYQRYHTFIVTAVLSVTGIATGTTAVLALMQAFIFSTALLIVTGAVVALVVVYGLLRHWGSSALTVLAPLPGLVWAAPISSGSDFASVPFLAYGLAIATATLYSDYKLNALLQPEPALSNGEPPSRRAGPFLPALTASALMAGLALMWFYNAVFHDAALQAVADSCLSLLSVFLLLPIGLSHLRFHETFVVRANRAHEQRDRWLEKLTFAAVPRWGLSLTGITLILIVLGWYGARGLLQDQMLLRAVSVLPVMVAGRFIAGGWREGVAFAAAVGTTSLLTLWASVVMPSIPNSDVIILQSATFAALLAMWGAWRVSHYRLRRDTARAARERVLADCGAPLIAAVVAIGAVLPLLVLQASALVAVAGLASAGVAGVLLFLAMQSGIEAIFPRSATVEHLYGHRRRH